MRILSIYTWQILGTACFSSLNGHGFAHKPILYESLAAKSCLISFMLISWRLRPILCGFFGFCFFYVRGYLHDYWVFTFQEFANIVDVTIKLSVFT